MLLRKKDIKYLKNYIKKNTSIFDRIRIWLDSRTIKNKTERQEYFYWNCADMGVYSDDKFDAFSLLAGSGIWGGAI